MKLEIIIIAPYFGVIDKDIHQLWLQTCAANTEIDFLLITDDIDALQISMPKNVKGVYMKWDECVNLVKNTFPFPVKVDAPYKLCDFRPAFGDVFSNYITDYDFWGHTDSGDTIYGNLIHFLTNDTLSLYDKIQIYGHFSLYRNSKDNNKRYLHPMKNGLTAQEIFNTSENLCFDDMFQKASINTLYVENGYPIMERIADFVADILPQYWGFRLEAKKKVPRVFEWNHGELFEWTVIEGKLNKREVGYVHFQKRKMINEVPFGGEHFYMIPNRFIPAVEPLTCQQIEDWSKDRLYLDPLKGRVKRIVNYAKRPEVFYRKVREKINKFKKV